MAEPWNRMGYSGRGNVEGLLDSLRGRAAIVCGNAATVYEDLEKFKVQGSRFEEAVVFAANDIGVYLPRVDHMVSLHAPKLVHWRGLRTDMSSEGRWREGTKAHTISETPEIDYHWSGLAPIFALSGYFAMQIAYLMGAEQIVLCGCPGDAARRFFDPGPRPDLYDYQRDGARQQLEQEMARVPEFKARVRSMSGWTREFFGGL